MNQSVKTRDLEVARQRLSHFIMAQAETTIKQAGVGYEEVDKAPETLDEMRRAYADARLHLKPYPVLKSGSDRTIYTGPYVNWAFRFWHDMVHIWLGLDLSFQSELTIAQVHCDHVTDEFGEHSLEARLMYADTFGQAIYYQMHGGFVVDQLAFALNYIKEY